MITLILMNEGFVNAYLIALTVGVIIAWMLPFVKDIFKKLKDKIK